MKDLGLSSNEVAIYLFLIKRNKCSIQTISKKTDIARSTVYETLKELLKKGLIEEVIEQKKKEYKAYPLKILKHNFIEEQKRLEQNIQHLDILESTIDSLGVFSTSNNDFQIRKYTGKTGARQLFWNTLSAKDTVYVYSYFGRSKYVGKQFYKSFVKESKLREIKEKVIVNLNDRVLNLFKRDVNTPLARTNPKDIKVIPEDRIRIQGETFIYNNIFATVYLDREDIVGFEVENKSFAETHKSMFNINWDIAKPLEFFLENEEQNSQI